MPNPTNWLPETQVNIGSAAAGTQTDPRIIGLANGNFLVAWVEAADGLIGTTAGSDLVGVVYDSAGVVVENAFRFNRSYTVDDEGDFEIAATNDGGFVVAFVDDDIADRDRTSIVYERFDSDYDYAGGGTFADETSNALNLFDPQIAVDLTDNSFTVTWTQTSAGVNSVLGRHVDAAFVMGPVFAAGAALSDAHQASRIEVLTDGNYVIVYEEDDAGTTGVEFRIVQPDGTEVATGEVGTGPRGRPQVAALAGGGFVVVYEDTDTGSGDVWQQVFDNTGASVAGPVAIFDGASAQTDAQVVALPTGGYAVLSYQVGLGPALQVFSPDGADDGSLAFLFTAPTNPIHMSVTADGRILLTRIGPSGEVLLSIIAANDGQIDASDWFSGGPNILPAGPIQGTIGNDAINGTDGDDTIFGLDNNDTINGGAGQDSLDGGSGDDTIRGSFGNDTLMGGERNDLLVGGTGDDVIDGGLGDADTASYGTATAGVEVYLLFTGLDVGGGAGIDTLSGIENLIGSDQNDRLSGDTNANLLEGGGGADILNGKEGSDTLQGNGGGDKLTTGEAADQLFGGLGSDSLFGLSGNDLLEGGDGNDFLYAGRDDDTVMGDEGDDEVRGNIGDDTLDGGLGNDDLRGGGDNDDLTGGDGNDFLFGENGLDTLVGGAGNDALTGGFGTGVLDGLRDEFVYDTVLAGGGFDRVKDFEDGTDILDLDLMALPDFNAVLAISSDTATGLRIDFGGGNVLFVENFFLASFDASDVVF